MKKIHIIFIFILIASCSSKKDILYIQNSNENFDYEISNLDYVLKTDDVLKIDILIGKTKSLISLENSNLNTFNESRESLIFKGYNIDKFGYIDYPEIGKIKASGLTITAFKKNFSDLIKEKQILSEFTLDVKVLNFNVTVLGEVNKPGKYYFNDSSLNFFQALGLAGDLTINGKRNKIKLIRDTNKGLKVYDVDLTKVDFINEAYFQIISGDVIIVNPNTSRIKNAGIIGNSGTLLSLLSFLLSSIIIINN